MSRDSDTTECGRMMQEDRQRRHADWHAKNRAALAAAASFTDKGETLLFREAWKPSVDFYPSTGFLSWYRRQAAP